MILNLTGLARYFPTLNEPGGTGGWHSGLCYIYDEFPAWGYNGSGTQKDTLPYRVAPLLMLTIPLPAKALRIQSLIQGF